MLQACRKTGIYASHRKSGGTYPASLPVGRAWKKDLKLKDFKDSLDYMKSNVKKERSMGFGSGIKGGLRS